MDIAPRHRAPLVALLALVLAAVGLMIWAGQKRNDIYGPTLLARAADGAVWVEVNQELLVLNADGRLLRRASPQSLGIPLPLTALAPMDDLMMAGSSHDGSVHLLTGQLMATGVLRPGDTGAGRLFDGYQLLWDGAAHTLIVSDTGNHRLLALTRDGKLIAQSGNFRFPNGLALDPRGFVLVADTNHHRLHAVDAGLADTGWKMDYHAARHPWPAFVSIAPGGQIYTAWLDNGMRLGVVRQHDVQGRVVRELELQPEAEPIAILARADDVLIADQGERGYHIYRYDHSGRRLADFGDAQVQATLDGAWRERRGYTRLGDGARIAVIALCVLLLIAALYAQRTPVSTAPATATGELKIDPPPAIDWGALTRQEWPAYIRAWWPLAVLLALFIALRFDLSGIGGALKHLLRSQHHDFNHVIFRILAAELLLIIILVRLVNRSLRIWDQTRTAQSLRRRQSYRLMLRALKPLSRLLEPDETLSGYSVSGQTRRPVLVIATNRRLFTFPVMQLGGSRIAWQCRWNEFARATRQPLEGLQKWLRPSAVRLEISRVDPGSRPLRLLCATPNRAEELQATVDEAYRQWWSSRPRAAIPPPIAVAPAPPARRLRPLLLSLLLPGLAQMDQGRIREGVFLMLIGGALLGQTLFSWAVALRRLADQPPMEPLLMLMVYGVLVLFAVDDAWQNEGGRR